MLFRAGGIVPNVLCRQHFSRLFCVGDIVPAAPFGALFRMLRIPSTVPNVPCRQHCSEYPVSLALFRLPLLRSVALFRMALVCITVLATLASRP
jgi:hypothetical protein